MSKKEINVKTSVKAIITGFVAYGIILFFIFSCGYLLIDALIDSLENINKLALSVTLAIIGSIILFFVIHGLCRLSTYDVFKKCKTDSENIHKISQKLNLFFLICVILSVLLSISFLFLRIDSIYKSIQISEMQYEQVFSSSFTQQLTNDMLKNYNEEKINLLFSTIILELGFVNAVFSLIPYQKKMLKLYNDK